MAKNLVVNSNLTIPSAEFSITFSRSSGAGGQNVNKVNSKVTLRWNINNSSSLSIEQKQKLISQIGSRLTNEGDLLLTSTITRDQARNIEDCYSKLRDLLLHALKKYKKRVKTKPSKASKERRKDSKKRLSHKKSLRRKAFD